MSISLTNGANIHKQVTVKMKRPLPEIMELLATNPETPVVREKFKNELGEEHFDGFFHRLRYHLFLRSEYRYALSEEERWLHMYSESSKEALYKYEHCIPAPNPRKRTIRAVSR
ncbi:MAG: hypothetical protein M1504_02645 [Candidatus Marsarchaeota archaeon]|nr:hypothetical protein [Candidatus Marsarchaeota archaeon]